MLRITLNGENAAFENHWGGEVSRILRKLADKLNAWEASPHALEGKLQDHNGNTVGEWEVTD